MALDINNGDPKKNGDAIKNEARGNAPSMDNPPKNSEEKKNLTASDKVVTIVDQVTPIVVFFGPRRSGKTMTLIRLVRYLSRNGYVVQPVRTFLPASNKHYKEICDKFDEMIASPEEAKSTTTIDFMLVRVLKNGHPICQIMEGPGEYYYDPENPNADFPPYVYTIMKGPNRVIWAVMVEPENTADMDASKCKGYVKKVDSLRKEVSQKDKFIITYNKIDQSPFVIGPRIINESEAKKDVDYRYPGLFKMFENDVPIFKLFKPYNCDFVTFQTGAFVNDNGTNMYVESDEMFPRKFWGVLHKRIRG